MNILLLLLDVLRTVNSTLKAIGRPMWSMTTWRASVTSKSLLTYSYLKSTLVQIHAGKPMFRPHALKTISITADLVKSRLLRDLTWGVWIFEYFDYNYYDYYNYCCLVSWICEFDLRWNTLDGKDTIIYSLANLYILNRCKYIIYFHVLFTPIVCKYWWLPSWEWSVVCLIQTLRRIVQISFRRSGFTSRMVCIKRY